MLPAPLLDRLVEDRVLPIVGAGFSLNSKLPPGSRMPQWQQLADELQDEVDLLTPNPSAIDILSSYAAEHGRQALVARLRRALHDGIAQPGDAHLGFARLPFDIVVTTNFDGLLEDAYREVRRPLRTLIREDQLASPVPRSAVTLVKAHGDYDNEPVLVATEEDYDSFLIQRPLLATYLANLLITRVALLIGYSLSDTDWRQLLAAVRSRLGRSSQQIYAVAVDPQPAAIEQFRRRGVTVVALRSDGRSYSNVLEAMFQEMRDHVARHALDRGTLRDEGALEELRLAAPSERRLVTFILPERLLAFYREQVFPSLRAAAIQPITPYDVDTPGTTLYATTTALIEESSAVVADISGGENSVLFEMGLATTARIERRPPIAVITSRTGAAPDLEGVHVLRDPFGKDAADDLAGDLLGWLRELLGPMAPSASRGDFSGGGPEDHATWQVVRAFRDLELALRERYPDTHAPMNELLRRAGTEQLIERRLILRLNEHRHLRNTVLHDLAVATPAQAAEVVGDVAAAIEQLRSTTTVGPIAKKPAAAQNRSRAR